MPLDVLHRVLASVDFGRWPQAETKRRILGHVGAHPEGIEISITDLCALTYRTSRTVVGAAVRDLAREGVIFKMGGRGSAPLFIMVNPVVENWDVPWCEDNPAAAELVRARSFHVEHRTRDKGGRTRLFARPIGRATNEIHRAPYGAREERPNRAPHGARDGSGRETPIARPMGRAMDSGSSRAPWTRATNPADPSEVVPTALDVEKSSSSGVAGAGAGVDPADLAEVSGRVLMLAAASPRGRFMAPSIEHKIAALIDRYGKDAVMAKANDVPRDLMPPNFVNFLASDLAPAPSSAAVETPAFDRAAELETELAGLRSKIDAYRGAGVDDQDDVMQDLLSRRTACETELADHLGGNPQ